MLPGRYCNGDRTSSRDKATIILRLISGLRDLCCEIQKPAHITWRAQACATNAAHSPYDAVGHLLYQAVLSYDKNGLKHSVPWLAVQAPETRKAITEGDLA